MPILRRRVVLSVARGVKAFLNLETGLTRSAVPEPGWTAPASPGTPSPETEAELARKTQKLRRSRRLLADKEGEIAELRARLSDSSASEAGGLEAGGVRPENVIWIFGYGHGRSGTTWLSSMMRSLDGFSVWVAPMVGKLFGHFYYSHSIDDRVIGWERQRSPFILSDKDRSWLGPLRAFILDNARAKFPNLSPSDHLVVNEAHGSEGAPLIMEALPESRMILLIRDPRDQMASLLDGRRRGSWIYERRKEFGMKDYLADSEPDAFVKACTEYNLLSLGNARKAYDAHTSAKAIVRYEDLVSDTLGTMKRLLADLELPVEDEEVERAVRQRSWENMPEEQKGEGKFYRKGTPGGWREDLTPEQVEIVEGAFAPLLEEFYPDAR